MNKREKSEVLYAEIAAEGYDLKDQSKRSAFITRAVNELGMTDKGAATYYVNAKTKHEGREVPSYYRSKQDRRTVDDQPGVDSRWSIIKVVDGKVDTCITFATEEKARNEFNSLRPENQEVCIVIPGVMQQGESVGHKDDEAPNMIAAKPGDEEE